MTLATDLRSALAAPIDLILREFGATATLRRPTRTRGADKTPTTLTPAVAGAPSPTRVVVLSGKRNDVQQTFGQETAAELIALCRDDVPVQMQDVVELTSGTLASAAWHYQVNELEALEAAGAWLLGLTRVPALPAS